MTTLDSLDPKYIPASEQFAWQPKELVAVLGSHERRHWGPVNSVAATPDGQHFLSGSVDRQLVVWDAETLDEIARLGAGSAVMSIRFVPKSDRWAAAIARGFLLGTWNGKQLAVTHRIKPESPTHMSLAIAPDGRRLAVCGHEIELWDIAAEPPRFERRITPKTGASFHSFAFTADGATLLSTQLEGKQVRRWRVADGVELPPLMESTHTIFEFAATPDGRRAVIAEGDESAQLWDIAAAEPRLIRTFPRPKTGGVRATYPVAISADGQNVWTGGMTESSRLLSFTVEGDNVHESVHGVLPLTSVALRPDGRRAFTGGTGGTLALRHNSEDSSRAVQPFDFTTWVGLAQFTPDNAGLWFGTSRARVGQSDIADDAFGARRQELTDLDTGTTFAVAPDGEWFVSANFNSLVQLWRYDEAVPRKQASANPGGYNAGYVAISPDHQTIAVQVENFVTSLLARRVMNDPGYSVRRTVTKKAPHKSCPAESVNQALSFVWPAGRPSTRIVAAVASAETDDSAWRPAISTWARAMFGNETVSTLGLLEGDLADGSYLSPRAAWVCSGQRRGVNS